MRIRNLLVAALRSMNRNKMRTFLTMLGIIIGVGSVIAMLAIGQGSRRSIEAQIAGLGTNVLMIRPEASSQGNVRMEAGTSQRLTLDDVQAIREHCPSVAQVSPSVRSGGQVIAEGQNWRTVTYGVWPDYFQIRNVEVESGEAFTEAEVKNAVKVCLVGRTVTTNLFGEGADPVGKTIRISKIPFRIIGTLRPKGESSFGQDQDDIVLAPFSTVQKRMLTINYVQMIHASAVSEQEIPAASAEITAVLKERHKLGASEDPDFSIRTQTEISEASSSTARVMTVLLAAIASISLIVGGIGIMNIMLVSVTERTREIGIRMSVGARGRDVLFQFLIEAMMISFGGGLIGIAVGAVASSVIARVMSWPVMITAFSVLLSFLFSFATGIFFGWYPARKAARLNPIEALRYE
jgi:putative ABC transport system permease protein